MCISYTEIIPVVLAFRGVIAGLGAYVEREDGWMLTPQDMWQSISEDIFGYHSSGEILAPVGRGWDIAKYPTIHLTTKNPPGPTVSSAEAANAWAVDEDPSARL